jgi:hypothetical protein
VREEAVARPDRAGHRGGPMNEKNLTARNQ